MQVHKRGRNRGWSGLAASLAMGLGGCATHLSTQPDWKVTNSETALSGVPYSLPMLQHEVTLTRAISNCPQPLVITNDLVAPADGSNDDKPFTITRGQLAMAMKVEAKERYVPGERYLIDYESLKAPFATSALAIEVYPSGVLKSLNASADDQTAQVIQAGVKFGFSVAKLTAGAPTPDLFQPLTQSDAGEENKTRDALRKASLEKLKANLSALPRTRYVACNAETTIWAARADENTSAQEVKTKDVNSANADVTRTSAVAALRNAQPKHVDALDGALALQAKATLDLADLVNAGKKINGRLGSATSVTWPRRFDSRSQNLPATNDTVKKFVGMLTIRNEPVVNAKAIADWIAEVRKADPVLADEFAAHEWFAGFLRPDGTAVEEKKALKGCADDPVNGQASEAACIDNYLNARIGLSLAESELDACKTPAPSSKACRGLIGAVHEADATRAGPGAAPPHKSPPTPGPHPSPFPRGRYARDGVADPGVFVRSPAYGILQVCRSDGPALAADASEPGEATDDFLLCTGQKAVYTSKPALLAPQLGQLRYLPVRNEAFEASELSLTLREDGAMESFGYKKTRAALPGFLGAGADAADQYRSYREGRDTARATALKTGREQELAVLQYQIDTLTKSRDLLKLQAPAPEAVDALKDIKAQTAALEADIALLKAEKTKIEATAALAALTAPGL